MPSITVIDGNGNKQTINYLPNLGQATAANSTPVVLASDQWTTTSGGLNVYVLNQGTGAAASNVAVTNFPSLQGVSGNVGLTGVNTTSGALNVYLLNQASGGASAVSVTNFPSNQSVSGNVTITNSGSLSFLNTGIGINNFPANQTVTLSNTGITVTNPVTSLAVNNFPNSQTVTLNTGNLAISGNLTFLNTGIGVNNFPTNQTVTLSNTGITVTNPVTSVGVNNFPANQSVSGNVTLLNTGISLSGVSITSGGLGVNILSTVTQNTIVSNFPTASGTSTSYATGLLSRLQGQDLWRTSFTEAGTGIVSPKLNLLQLGGSTISTTAGNLSIVTSTTANDESLIQSALGGTAKFWQNGINLRWQLTLSQRIANNNFYVILADLIGTALSYTINSTTSVTVTIPNNPFTAVNVGQFMELSMVAGTAGTIPGRFAILSVSGNTVTFTVAAWPASGSGTLTLLGWNYYRALYTSTTATNVNFDAQRNGYATGDTVATINTTAAPGHVGQIYLDGTTAVLSDALVASNVGYQFTPRANRIANLADDTTQLYLFIRTLNGTTAPASATTATFGFLNLENFVRVGINVLGQNQGGGTAITTGTGASGPGIPRVTISNDSSLAANQSINISQIGAATASVITAQSGGKTTPTILTSAQGNAAFIASQATKTPGVYGLAITATDGGQGVDLAFYVTATATASIPALSSLASNTFTTSTNHGFNVGTPVAFTTVGSVTGVTANQVYYVIAANLTATTFSISNVPNGPILAIGGATTSAVLSANGAFQIVVQDSLDNGTSYYDIYHSEIIPYTSAVAARYFLRDIPILSGKPQLVITLIGGSGLTNTTFQFNGAYRSLPTAITRQFIDRSVTIPSLLNSQPLNGIFGVGNTLAGTTIITPWEFRNCKSFTLNVQSSMYYSPGVTTAPIYGILLSMDGTFWFDSGLNLPVNAANTNFGATLLNQGPINYAKPYIKTAAVGSGPAIASLSTATFTTTPPHGLNAGMVVVFNNIGSMTGVSINTYYYVILTGLTTTAFQISATPNGAAITPGGTLGAATLYPVTQLYSIVKGQA